MKAITPVNIWHEGSLKEAVMLEAFSSFDDLKTYATFTYKLLEEVVQNPINVPVGIINPLPPMINTNIIASGVVFMGGQDYIDWDNSNQQAYEFVADTLNLEFVIEEQP